MSDIKKLTMCKVAKRDAMNEDREFFLSLVSSPQFFCRKCGRLANSEKNLCKPESMR